MLSIIDKSGGFSGDQVKIIFVTRRLRFFFPPIPWCPWLISRKYSSNGNISLLMAYEPWSLQHCNNKFNNQSVANISVFDIWHFPHWKWRWQRLRNVLQRSTLTKTVISPKKKLFYKICLIIISPQTKKSSFSKFCLIMFFFLDNSSSNKKVLILNHFLKFAW